MIKISLNFSKGNSSQIFRLRPQLFFESIKEAPSKEVTIYFNSFEGFGFSNSKINQHVSPLQYDIWLGDDLLNNSYVAEGNLGSSKQISPKSIEVFGLGDEAMINEWELHQSKTRSQSSSKNKNNLSLNQDAMRNAQTKKNKVDNLM